MQFRSILFIALLTWFITPASGQNDFYAIYGPQDVSLCSFDTAFYGIETSAQLDRTTWTLIPDMLATITGSLYSADIQFFIPGTYLLVATSTTVSGEILSDTIQIYVFGSTFQPEIIGCYELDSLSGCYQVCAHSQTELFYPNGFFQYTVTGADGYYLDDNASSIIITWGAGGLGTVTFNNTGCTVQLCFEILPTPIADFDTSPPAANDTITVCKNQEIYFDNLSYNGISYLWQFGDGAVDNGFDASHTYTDEGFYTVALSANSICDCADEKQVVVEVLPAPAPTLDCVNSVCPESRQRYTATTAGCTQYTWSVSSNGTIVNGGESTDDFIEVIWHDGPDGYITLAVSGCMTSFCSFSNTFRVPIITPEGPVEGDASVCSGQISTYTAPYFPGTQYQWQVGPSGVILGGQNTNGVTVQWSNVNAPVSTSVQVSYTNCFLECDGSDFLNVAITPQIRIAGDAQVCQNSSASVSAEVGFNSFSPVNVSWHIEDASGNTVYTAPGLSSSFMHTFNYPPGEYAWVATNSSFGYCNEYISIPIQVTAMPDIPLGIRGEQKICPGQPYGFTIENAGNYATLWTITDGTSTANYSGQTCQHTFGPTPPYIVEAVHADIQFQACLSDPVSIVLGTAADLTINGPDEVCFNSIESFSTEYFSGIDYTWEVIPADHGEIKRSDLNTVDVFWTQSGAATLRLNACGVILDKAVLVHALPVFNILGPTAACANELAALSTDQPLMAHEWVNDNDVTLGVQNNIQLPPGSFGVAVTDGFGCTSEKSIQVTVYPAPVVHLSSAFEETFCTNIPGGVEIVANTDGVDYMYTWFLDDVNIGPGGPVYNVTNFGTYHVEVTNQYGCKTVSQKLAFSDCCAPSTCGFTASGFPAGCGFAENDFAIVKTESECQVHQFTPTIAGLTPGSVRWIIRSNSEGIIADLHTDVLDYAYQKPGYYHIVMLGEIDGFPYDAATCGHFEKLTDTVRAVAGFKHDGICTATAIVFEDLTTFLPNESISGWSWDFGDPASGVDNTSTDQNPMHMYAAAGIYEVTLNVTMASGCVTTKKLPVEISGGPVLAPIYDLIYCEDEAMSFQLPGQVYETQWTFGDPGSGAENMAGTESVFHTFDLPGAYFVNVAAKDIYSCPADVTFMVDITQNTLAGLIDVDPLTPLCEGDTALLTAPPGGQMWTWSTEETTAQINVTESNQYNVLIRDQYNCTYSPPAVFIEVLPKPEVIIRAREILGPGMYGAWDNSLQICDGTEFEIQAFSASNVSYHWSHGPTDPLLQFTSEGSNLPGPGVFVYTVYTIDLASGCISDSSLIEIEIYTLPDIPVISLTGGSACSFDDNILQVTNPEPGVTYLWSDGQTGTTITMTKAGLFYVEAINDHGCSTRSNTIVINPSAPVDQIPGGCFIACDPLEVCLPVLSQVASYIIYQDGNVFQSGNGWPANYTITTDGSYTIEVTTFNGCIATSEPLDVMLYTGVGSITVETWNDLDGDGMISGGDVLLPGIPVQIISSDGMHIGATETVPDGQFVFEDYPAEEYLALIDRNLLSSQWKVVLDSVTTQIVTCGDSVVVSLLLMNNCTVTGPDVAFELCPGELLTLGDSTWSDTGTYVMHMNSSTGCDSTFQVMISTPDSLEINVTVWVDVDQNGILSPLDTVIQGITIVVDALINQAPYTGITDINGMVNGFYPSGDYLVSVDTMLLPAQFVVTYGEEFVPDTACGLVSIDFLLTSSCTGVFVIQQETLCPGDSLLFDQQWITGPGQYTFIHTDPVTMCDTIIDIYVTMSADIVIQSMVDWNCQDFGTITLDISGEGPFSIWWSNGIFGDTMLTGLDQGDYSVIITDVNGCSVTDTFSVVPSSGLTFDVPGLYTVQQGDSVLITITGDIDEPGLTFDWIPAEIFACPTCPSSWAYPEQSTTVAIQITDADSCLYSLQTVILVVADSSGLDEIYVPNVFSPNGDGINDFWTMFSQRDDAYVQELAVFDRWGTKVFSKGEFFLNTFTGWDGTFKGKTMNPGVFVYKAKLTLGDGKEINLKGDVTLMR